MRRRRNADPDFRQLERAAQTGGPDEVIRWLRSVARWVGYEQMLELLLSAVQVPPYGGLDEQAFLPDGRMLEIDNQAVITVYEDNGNEFVESVEFEDEDYWPLFRLFLENPDHPWAP